MWPYIVVAGAVLLIREVVKEWGWYRNWEDENIVDLPKTPGAYIFYNKKDQIIHVGSSGNLHQRISKHEKRKKMSSFDWQKTDTEDDAYDLEMRLQDKLGYDGR